MMAEDVEIPSNATANDESAQSHDERPITNLKNDGQRYDENSNRITERHILFHFFTLFSISFISGILLIHISLWMNSYMHSVFSPPQPYQDYTSEEAFGVEQSPDPNPDGSAQSWYTTVYTQDERMKELFKSTFYYTGKYFDHASINASEHIISTNLSPNFPVK